LLVFNGGQNSLSELVVARQGVPIGIRGVVSQKNGVQSSRQLARSRVVFASEHLLSFFRLESLDELFDRSLDFIVAVVKRGANMFALEIINELLELVLHLDAEQFGLTDADLFAVVAARDRTLDVHVVVFNDA